MSDERELPGTLFGYPITVGEIPLENAAELPMVFGDWFDAKPSRATVLFSRRKWWLWNWTIRGEMSVECVTQNHDGSYSLTGTGVNTLHAVWQFIPWEWVKATWRKVRK